MTSGPSPATAQCRRMPLVRTIRCSRRIPGRLGRGTTAVKRRRAAVWGRMTFEFIRYEKRDHVAVVTINRPEVMNSLHPGANEELDRVWDEFAADADLWVAILTGAGEKAFSAGNDLKWT